MSGDAPSDTEFRQAVNRVYRWYAAGFIAFVLVLALLEQQGLSRQGIGLIFLLATARLLLSLRLLLRRLLNVLAALLLLSFRLLLLHALPALALPTLARVTSIRRPVI